MEYNEGRGIILYKNDFKTKIDYDLDESMQQSSKALYQPQSLDESLAILREYQGELSKEKYDSIESTVRGQAIEHQYCDRFDIELMVKHANGKVTYDEAKELIKKRIKVDLENARGL